MTVKQEFDQYYTKPDVAADCYQFVNDTITGLLDLNSDKLLWIEPSAGQGSFYNRLPQDRRIGLDIDPKHPEVAQQDFLSWDYSDITVEPQQIIMIGNPPFGRRAKQAVQFFNKAAQMANTIGFIVPIQFRKYGVHKQLYPGFQWIATLPLSTSSFYTSDSPEYQLNSEFQIWTLEKHHIYQNMRILEAPAISHPDFQIWQYNNTEQALKVFDEDFDFAVPRQGYQDYTRRETDPDRCEKTKQWILFKANNLKIRQRLLNMDFDLLSQNNTIVPGFGKHDVVKEYERILNGA